VYWRLTFVLITALLARERGDGSTNIAKPVYTIVRVCTITSKPKHLAVASGRALTVTITMLVTSTARAPTISIYRLTSEYISIHQGS